MTKPWNELELARLSADLDEELEAIFDQMEAALPPPGDPAAGATGAERLSLDADPLPSISPAGLREDDEFPTAGFPPAAAGGTPPAGRAGPGTADADWLDPSLLGEPEVADGKAPLAGLTPEAARELSRLIEAAVEKGLAKALAKWR